MCLHLEAEEQWQARDSRLRGGGGQASCKEPEGHPPMLLSSSQFSVTNR